jgi:hypothetical protein
MERRRGDAVRILEVDWKAGRSRPLGDWLTRTHNLPSVSLSCMLTHDLSSPSHACLLCTVIVGSWDRGIVGEEGRGDKKREDICHVKEINNCISYTSYIKARHLCSGALALPLLLPLPPIIA